MKYRRKEATEKKQEQKLKMMIRKLVESSERIGGKVSNVEL